MAMTPDNIIVALDATRATDKTPAVIWAAVAAAAQKAHVADAAAATAAALTDNSGGEAADNTIAAIGDTKSGYVYYQNVAAAAADNACDQYDLNALGNGTLANPVDPDVPRNIKLTVTDAGAGIDAFTFTVTGTGVNGEAVVETFVFGGGLVQEGAKVFAKLTSIVLADLNGEGAGDLADLGWQDKLGVPHPAAADAFAVEKLVSAGAEEAASDESATLFTWTPTTVPDAAKDYELWYSCNDSPQSVADAIKELSDEINKLITDQADIRAQFNVVLNRLESLLLLATS